MLDRRTRALKDQILQPLLQTPIGRLDPFVITVASLVPGLAAAGAAALGWRTVALAFFWLNRGMDGLDGLIARDRAMQSDLGGYLDIMVDFVVYAAIPVGVWWGSGAGRPLTLILLLCLFYINTASWMYLAAIQEKHHARSETTSIVVPNSLIEGTETAIFYTAFILLPGYLPWLFGFMSLALLFSVGQRLRGAFSGMGRTTTTNSPRSDRNRADAESR